MHLHEGGCVFENERNNRETDDRMVALSEIRLTGVLETFLLIRGRNLSWGLV